ncbi:MAG: tetratricopeptide repeat protein [Candidatus Auribacterota bacterium]|jgi:tetratricopeptide (TPR) repeat protein|nr:tetratricopeptide repeat protein [Candidatus Auribacterota bacterium]
MIKTYIKIFVLLLSTIYANFAQSELAQEFIEYDNQPSTTETQDEDSLFSKGYYYYRNRQFDEAASIFQQIINDQPDHYGANLNMGSIYHKQNQLEKAIEKFSLCKELQPENAQAYFNIGLVYMDMAQYDLALKALLKAHELDQINARILFFIGDTYFLLGDYEKALIYFTQTWSIAPAMTINHLRIADCYRAQKNYEAEADVYRQMIQQNPSAQLYYRLGIAMGKAGNITQEIRSYQMALALQPDHTDARFNLGLAYYNSGNMDEAKKQFELITTDTETPDHEGLYYLGLIAYTQGDTFTAWSYYERLKDLDPQFSDRLHSILK